MASTYTPLGVELMATGENAGTWGTKTNTNLQIIEQISGGYKVQTLNTSGAGANTTTLSESDGSTGATVATRVIIFGAVSPETISGNKIVTFPVTTENFYLIKNSTSGSYTVQLKAASGSGATVTWATDDKGWKLVYFDGVATNTGVYDIGMGDVTTTGTQTLTNKTLTSPKIGTSILDTSGNELFLLTATGSAINEVTLANAAAGNDPSFSATGGDTNIGMELKTKGSGVIKAEDSGGTVSAVKIAGKETIWIPAAAMYAATTNGADGEQVETTATRPDMKVFDFDASTKQYTQFTIAMPKSWNEGTLTYQVYWAPSTTNTGNCIFGLQGVACADGDTIDVAYGTAIELTDAGIGTVEDQQVTSESSAMTVAGSPAAGEQSYFQLYRDAADGSDSFTGEARVLGIKLFFTTDAANDV
jgi:hypothetical protein